MRLRDRSQLSQMLDMSSKRNQKKGAVFFALKKLGTKSQKHKESKQLEETNTK